MAPLDHITAAATAALQGGTNSAIIDYFHCCMDEAARVQFDVFLLGTNDELVSEGGPREYRFFLRCLRELERQRAAVKSAPSTDPGQPKGYK
jgi:hypothetical protein